MEGDFMSVYNLLNVVDSIIAFHVFYDVFFYDLELIFEVSYSSQTVNLKS